MIRNKRDYLSYFYLFFTFILAAKMIKLSIGNLYDGIALGGRVSFYAVYILLYLELALYVFGTAEQYFTNYGVLVLTRYQKKHIFYIRYMVSLIKKVVIYEIGKLLLCYGVTMIMDIAEPIDWDTFFVFGFINLVIDMILCTMQTILEICLDDRWAVCAVCSFSIISLAIPDILYSRQIKMIPLPCFVNWGMKLRVEEVGISYPFMIAGVLIIWAVTLLVGLLVVKKKEII